MSNSNPFKKKNMPTATPSVSEAETAAIVQKNKALLEEEMLKAVQQEDNKSKIHRTTLEIPADIYAQIEVIRAETELSLKGFFMVAAKKYIADFNSKK